VLLAWKESGGFAGTFSPNAAFAQATYQMTAAHTYVFKLKWKTNKNALGATIYAAAGYPAPFSPTRMTVELTSREAGEPEPSTFARRPRSSSHPESLRCQPAACSHIFRLLPQQTGLLGCWGFHGFDLHVTRIPKGLRHS
jgi:hypothetical protein